MLVLVGTKEAISRAVGNVRPLDRNSMLRERLQEIVQRPLGQRLAVREAEGGDDLIWADDEDRKREEGGAPFLP